MDEITSIVKLFLSYHKITIQKELEGFTVDYVYSCLIGGLYGELRENSVIGGVDIEIPSKDTDSGLPVVFNFNPVK